MNQKITYEELLNLSIDEFNARKNKNIREILLYLYQKNQVSGLNGYLIDFREIYLAFVERRDFVADIIKAAMDLIDETDSEELKLTLEAFILEFSDEEEEYENPLSYYYVDGTEECVFDNFALFFAAFDVLESYEYDLSKLLYNEDEPCTVAYIIDDLYIPYNE